MFSGIIEEIGKIVAIKNSGDGKIFTVKTSEKFAQTIQLGDSIAINGACQTVIEKTNTSFSVFSSPQTLSLTNLGLCSFNEPVNLEKALTLSKTIDGHLVSGHIDGMGVIKKIIAQQEGYLFYFQIPHDILNTVVKKGSIACDGISLTVYDLLEDTVIVSVIPFTYQNTVLRYRKEKDKVNIETDLLGKYVFRFLERYQGSKKKPITLDFLKENGFLK